eukprot:scaffold8519_cov277-Pinguiococcus_pyrenoidosus.AAC.3
MPWVPAVRMGSSSSTLGCSGPLPGAGAWSTRGSSGRTAWRSACRYSFTLDLCPVVTCASSSSSLLSLAAERSDFASPSADCLEISRTIIGFGRAPSSSPPFGRARTSLRNSSSPTVPRRLASSLSGHGTTPVEGTSSTVSFNSCTVLIFDLWLLWSSRSALAAMLLRIPEEIKYFISPSKASLTCGRKSVSTAAEYPPVTFASSSFCCTLMISLGSFATTQTTRSAQPLLASRNIRTSYSTVAAVCAASESSRSRESKLVKK